jgi:hypothetical protein
MADPEALEEASKALSFAEFLERMKEPAAADLVRGIKRCASSCLRWACLLKHARGSGVTWERVVGRISFIKEFEERKPDPDRDSVLVQVRARASRPPAPAPPDHGACHVGALARALTARAPGRTFWPTTRSSSASTPSGPARRPRTSRRLWRCAALCARSRRSPAPRGCALRPCARARRALRST